MYTSFAKYSTNPILSLNCQISTTKICPFTVIILLSQFESVIFYLTLAISLQVGSEWDGKESIFRNHGGILGVYDDPQIAIRTVTGRVAHTDIVWEDPVGMMASTHRMKLDAGSTVAHHKPTLSKPLRNSCQV